MPTMPATFRRRDDMARHVVACAFLSAILNLAKMVAIFIFYLSQRQNVFVSLCALDCGCVGAKKDTILSPLRRQRRQEDLFHAFTQ